MNFFFGTSLVCASGVFSGRGRDRLVRTGLLAAGALTLAGLIGPVVGSADWWVIGVLGDGVVFPLVCLLVGTVLIRAAEGRDAAQQLSAGVVHQEETHDDEGHRGRAGGRGRAGARTTRVPVPDLCCLWAESAAAPMNIALIGTFDAVGLVDDAGEVALNRIRSCIAAHLDQVPMLRRVLRPTRPGQGRPVWTDARDFSIDRHVVLAPPRVPFCDDQEFLDWCAAETLRPLNRSRPLWRICVVPGLPSRRIGVLVVVHHVVADGLRGVAMIAGLLDVDPAGRGVSPAPWRPSPTPTGTDLVLDNLHGRMRAVRSLRLNAVRQQLACLKGLRAEVRTRAPVTVLGGEIGAGRQLVVVREPLENLRVAAHHLGCTINDLLLAAVTFGLREMLCPSGHCGDGLALRASVPVGDTGGHQGGMITVLLPVGVADPGERLRRIVAVTSRGKRSPHEGVAGIVAMPASLAHLGVLWARRAATTHINLYVTNVPGPPCPLSLAGARMREVVPLAPLVAGVRLSVTALSYDGVFSVALLADEAVTDVTAMAAGVRSGFATYLSHPGELVPGTG